MTYDVREIANLVLDEASRMRIEVSNLAINKIVYFLHAEHLVTYGEPLVDAKIEAWTYGPVFRELYSEFKKYRDAPIESRATRLNPKVGKREVCAIDSREPIVNDLRKWIQVYARLTAFQLMDLSHEKNGPWDTVFNHQERTNPGMHISDSIIKQAFVRVRHH